MKTINMPDENIDIISCILQESLIKYNQYILQTKRDILLDDNTNKDFAQNTIKLYSNRIKSINNILKQLEL
jgi:flavorubredoxin